MDSFLDKFLRWLRFRKVTKHIPKDSIVCDIGCGNDAYFLKNISNLIKHGVGLDKDIKNYKNPKLEFKRIKILKEIPLEKGSCDVVTMIAVLEHLLYPQEILNECFRILKKGGKLILTTDTPLAKPILEFLAFKLKLIDEDEIQDHKNYFWLADIKKMLLKTGFKEENIKNYFIEYYLNFLVIVQK